MSRRSTIMTDRPGGILTPSQREFLRGVNLEEKSNSAKSMTQSRIVERIQTSYIEDTPLIASSLSAGSDYNTLNPEKIAEVENREAFVEGLILQITLVRELATAIGADPSELVRDGLTRELISAEDWIRKKAKNNPEEVTLKEMGQLSGEIPQELQDQINSTIEEIDEIRPGKHPNRTDVSDESTLDRETIEEIIDELPKERHDE